MTSTTIMNSQAIAANPETTVGFSCVEIPNTSTNVVLEVKVTTSATATKLFNRPIYLKYAIVNIDYTGSDGSAAALELGPIAKSMPIQISQTQNDIRIYHTKPELATGSYIAAWIDHGAFEGADDEIQVATVTVALTSIGI